MPVEPGFIKKKKDFGPSLGKPFESTELLILEMEVCYLRTNTVEAGPPVPPSCLINVFSSLSSANWTMGWSGSESRWMPEARAVICFSQQQITRILNSVVVCDLNICPWGIGLRLLTHYPQLSHEQIIHSLITPLNPVLSLAEHVCILMRHVRKQNCNLGAEKGLRCGKI